MKNWLTRMALKYVKASGGIPTSEGVRGSQLYDWMTAGSGAAGVAVNERTAMSVSAVYACVELIGGSVASLPLNFYRRTESGREQFTPEIWWMFNERPFANWSASSMWGFVLASKLLHGDGFVQIHRAGGSRSLTGRILGFEPIHPLSVQVEKIDGRLKYTLYKDGDSNGRPYIEVIDQDDMLHFPGPGFDGKRSLSQLKHCLRNPAGVAIAADEHSARFFQNGARPDFAIEIPGDPSAEQQEMYRRTWAERHQGVYNSHLPALLSGGATIHTLTMNAEDAQLLTTRSFQVEDIARIFGVPPHLIGHTEKSTSWGTGIEQMSIGFVKFTLQRHLVGFEQEINAKVYDSDKYFCQFQTAGLERGDIKTRNESYRIALGRPGEPGWMTANEVRRKENMPPIKGGDVLHNATQLAQTPEQGAAL